MWQPDKWLAPPPPCFSRGQRAMSLRLSKDIRATSGWSDGCWWDVLSCEWTMTSRQIYNDCCYPVGGIQPRQQQHSGNSIPQRTFNFDTRIDKCWRDFGSAAMVAITSLDVAFVSVESRVN